MAGIIPHIRTSFGAMLLAGAGLLSTANAEQPIPPSPPLPTDHNHVPSALDPHNITKAQKIEELKENIERYFSSVIKRQTRAFKNLSDSLYQLRTLVTPPEYESLVPKNLKPFLESESVSIDQFEKSLKAITPNPQNDLSTKELITIIEQYQNLIKGNRYKRLHDSLFIPIPEIHNKDFKHSYQTFQKNISSILINKLQPIFNGTNLNLDSIQEAQEIILALDKLQDETFDQSTNKTFNITLDGESIALTNYFPQFSTVIADQVQQFLATLKLPTSNEVTDFELFAKSFIVGTMSESLFTEKVDLRTRIDAMRERFSNDMKINFIRALEMDKEQRLITLSLLKTVINTLGKNFKSSYPYDHLDTTIDSLTINPDLSTDQAYYDLLIQELVNKSFNPSPLLIEKAEKDLAQVINNSASKETTKQLRKFLAYSLLTKAVDPLNTPSLEDFSIEFLPSKNPRHTAPAPIIVQPLKDLFRVIFNPSLITGVARHPNPEVNRIFSDFSPKEPKAKIVERNEKYLQAFEFFESILLEAQLMIRDERVSKNEFCNLCTGDSFQFNSNPQGLGIEQLRVVFKNLTEIFRELRSSPLMLELADRIHPYAHGLIFGHSMDYIEEINDSTFQCEQACRNDCPTPAISKISSPLYFRNFSQDPFAENLHRYLNPRFPLHRNRSSQDEKQAENNFINGFTAAVPFSDLSNYNPEPLIRDRLMSLRTTVELAGDEVQELISSNPESDRTRLLRSKANLRDSSQNGLIGLERSGLRP